MKAVDRQSEYGNEYDEDDIRDYVIAGRQG
jgi:hypothetical protein